MTDFSQEHLINSSKLISAFAAAIIRGAGNLTAISGAARYRYPNALVGFFFAFFLFLWVSLAFHIYFSLLSHSKEVLFYFIMCIYLLCNILSVIFINKKSHRT